MPRKAPCPRCQSRGGDTAGDNLTVYDDGVYCHACGYRGKSASTQEQPVRDPQNAAAELAMIQTLPFGAPHKPYLSQQAVQAAGVRYSVDDSGQPDAVYYPYYRGGQVVDYKKRFTADKRFIAVTGKINRAELFGEHSVNPERRAFLIITEGEDDKLAVDTMLMQKGKDYPVVSVQNGANESGKLDQAVLGRLEFIQSFRKVVLCLDNDSAGHATQEALAELLAPRQEVRVIQLQTVKDAYELLESRQDAAECFWQALSNARRYSPEGVLEARDVRLQELQQASMPGYTLPYPLLNRKLHGLRKGEITLLVAGTGIGKTTLAREISYHLVTQHGLTTGNIFLEEQWRKTGQGYIAIDNNVPLPRLREQPSTITQEQWLASYQKFYTSGLVHHFKHFGSVASDRLQAKMRYFSLALQCDFIFLDHITMVLSGEGTHDERKDIDILMTRLAELVTETGVGVAGVVHLKRSTGKDFNRGEEVALTDLRGSSQLEALSFNVIAAERDQQSESSGDVTLLRLLKNREWGVLGVCDRLVYNHCTGRLLPPGQQQRSEL